MLLRLFNFIYFQYITSMGLPSVPAPPRQPATEIAAVLAAAAGARAGPGRPPQPHVLALSPLLSLGGDLGELQGPPKHQKEKLKWGSSTDVAGASSSLGQPRVSLPVLSQILPASRPKAAAVPPAPALPHVGSPSCRAVVPWGPRPAGLAAPGPSTSAASPRHRQEPASLPGGACGASASQQEVEMRGDSLNTRWLLREANTIREGLRGLIRLHKALEM